MISNSDASRYLGEVIGTYLQREGAHYGVFVAKRDVEMEKYPARLALQHDGCKVVMPLKPTLDDKNLLDAVRRFIKCPTCAIWAE